MSDSTTARRPLSKSLRFAVLERDNFTCQYCGATPKNGALEVDHIIPVADGGKTEADNLITSCEPCNKGKGRKSRGIAPLPDMTALADEAAHKSAEIRRWKRENAKAIKQMNDAAGDIKAEYELSIPRKMLVGFIDDYGIAEVNFAAQRVAYKGISSIDPRGQAGYMRGVLRNRRESDEPTAPLPTFERKYAPVQKCDLPMCPFGNPLNCPDDLPAGRCFQYVDGSPRACTYAIELFGWESLERCDYDIERFRNEFYSDGPRGVAGFIEYAESLRGESL